MRVVLQRVKEASVEVNGQRVGAIGPGLLALLGIAKDDAERDAEYLADKIVQLRIFNDGEGKMNRSLIDTGGALLIVSQFTLYGDCRKGRRPGFDQAARPDDAKRLYEYFVSQIKRANLTVATGIYQAEMNVSLINHGPVTFILDSK